MIEKQILPEFEQYKKQFASSGGKAKNSKMTPEERLAHSKMMTKAKKDKQNKA